MDIVFLSERVGYAIVGRVMLVLTEFLGYDFSRWTDSKSLTNVVNCYQTIHLRESRLDSDRRIGFPNDATINTNGIVVSTHPLMNRHSSFDLHEHVVPPYVFNYIWN
jgi:hypothetical protein